MKPSRLGATHGQEAFNDRSARHNNDVVVLMCLAGAAIGPVRWTFL
jgi:hypothetical protein